MLACSRYRRLASHVLARFLVRCCRRADSSVRSVRSERRTVMQLVAVSLLSIFWDCLHAVHSGGRDRGKSVFL